MIYCQQNVQQNVQHVLKPMPDFLTRRSGTWHFVRRVPAEFAHVDERGIVKHSTKVRIAQDRTGRRAARVADKLNEELELYWKALANGHSKADLSRYDDARRRARSLGFEYIENSQLLMDPPEQRLNRLETLVSRGIVKDPSARAALLGTEKRPVVRLSKLFDEYEGLTKDELKDFSLNQLRVWRNSRMRAVENFVSVVGDKQVNEVTVDDAIDYADWWRDRITRKNVAVKSANKDIGQLSRMLKDISIRRRLNIPDIFHGLRLRGQIERSRMPFEAEFIQEKLLTTGALADLNEDARHVLYVVAETGMRPSEVVNLQESAIRLDAKIPHVKIQPDGRKLKTEDSEREIPLVGVALAAMKLRPKGFPRYRDKSSSLSATVNKFLGVNGLRPTKDHSVYSLRHSFKDRLVAVEAPDSLIDSLMGHKTYKPKYGKGPSLELKLKYLQQIAFKAPASL
jgi:integrase